MQARPLTAAGGLAAWGLLNGFLVLRGWAELPLVSLGLGMLGASAVVSIASLLAKTDAFNALRYCGRNSLVIYLAFFLPMAVSRTVLLKSGLITDLGTISVLVTASGVIGALCIYWALRATPLWVLFERPARFWLAPKPRMSLQAAE